MTYKISCMDVVVVFCQHNVCRVCITRLNEPGVPTSGDLQDGSCPVQWVTSSAAPFPVAAVRGDCPDGAPAR